MKFSPLVSTVQLNVQQIESVCLFELVWGNGHRERVTIPYPDRLTSLYYNWQAAYLAFYRHYPIVSTEPGRAFRGKAAGGGMIAAKGDQQEQLVTRKKILLLEFDRWLAHPDLRSIYRQLAQVIQQSKRPATFDLLIACTPIALAKLPWESWDITSRFATIHTIRIARMPATIHQTALQRMPRIQTRPRILAVFGGGIDDTIDRRWVQSLDRQVADVTILSQRSDQSIQDWKAEFITTLKDKRGWEVFFFAGHSRETEVTGGALEIAPG